MEINSHGHDNKNYKTSIEFKAFVGGLSWETTEEGIFMYFESIVGTDNVVSATVLRDRYVALICFTFIIVFIYCFQVY